MKLALTLTAGILLCGNCWASDEYVEVTYNRPDAPVLITEGSMGTISLYCMEGSKPIEGGSETSPGNTTAISDIPSGGEIDAPNENCSNPMHEELWLTRADQTKFLAYQKTCLDDSKGEDNFDNGGRIYHSGDKKIDQMIRNRIGNVWVKMNAWNELFGHNCTQP